MQKKIEYLAKIPIFSAEKCIFMDKDKWKEKFRNDFTDCKKESNVPFLCSIQHKESIFI